jgi:hypothetical protein
MPRSSILGAEGAGSLGDLPPSARCRPPGTGRWSISPGANQPKPGRPVQYAAVGAGGVVASGLSSCQQLTLGRPCGPGSVELLELRQDACDLGVAHPNSVDRAGSRPGARAPYPPVVRVNHLLIGPGPEGPTVEAISARRRGQRRASSPARRILARQCCPSAARDRPQFRPARLPLDRRNEPVRPAPPRSAATGCTSRRARSAPALRSWSGESALTRIRLAPHSVLDELQQ